MKRLIVIAAAFVAFAACSKLDNPVFQDSNERKKVVLQVNAGTDSGTKVDGKLNDEGKIIFVWDEDDSIKVTRGGQSAIFSIRSGMATSSATFEGIMPGAEGPFDVQFPVTDTDLPLTQDYVENGLPHNLMKAVATGCTQTDNITLTPVYSALRLNLYSDAYDSLTIGKIVVTTLEDSEKVYTLNFSSAVSLGTTSSAATPFFFVIPACTTRIKVDLYDTPSETVMCNTFLTTTAQVFNAGKVRNMPAKRMSIQYFDNGTDYGEAVKFGNKWWAPVNCGYRPGITEYGDCTMGKYYQWGRRNGLVYYKGLICKEYDICYNPYNGANGTEDPNTFYHDGSSVFGYDWIVEGSNYFWNGNGNDTLKSPKKGDFDPCPSGWRVPLKNEMASLLEFPMDNGERPGVAYLKIYGQKISNNHCDTLFLPFAGSILSDGKFSNWEYEDGEYWTSSVYDPGEENDGQWVCDSYYFHISPTGYSCGIMSRSEAYTVRCVRE